LALFFTGPAPLDAATEIETLRDDLRRTQEDFRKLLDLQQQTQRRMEELQKKMDAVESAARAQAAPAPTAPAPPATAPIAAAPPSPIPPGRLGFSLGGRALLFDLGVTGSFIGNLTSARDASIGQRATFPGLENRIFPSEIEIAASGAVDPYVRVDTFFEFAEESGREIGASIEEAYLTTLALPWGFQIRGGRMRPQFGLLGHLHLHDMPQIDAPNVLTNFLGQERLQENGAEVSWVAPLPFYLEARTGIFNGDNAVSYGVGSIRNPLITGRVKTFLELGDDHGIQLGVSAATGPNLGPDPTVEPGLGSRTVLVGGDFKYKWKPLGRPYTQFILAGEYLFSHSRRVVLTDPIDPATGANVCPFTPTPCIRQQGIFNRQGFYVFADYQLARRWFAGTRFDWSQFPPDPLVVNQTLVQGFVLNPEIRRGAREYAIAPYIVFKPSEFFQLRAEYKHTQRNYTKNADEGFLQAVFILGTHPPHPW
jgi:hypothetical protein